MDWLLPGIDVPLVVIRGIHFASSALTAGALVFWAVIAEPALTSGSPEGSVVRNQISWVARGSLALAATTGAIWLALVAVSMGGVSFVETMSSDVFWTVVNETQFGRVALIRLGLAALLAGCLIFERGNVLRWLESGVALTLVASLAWTGHAGSTTGNVGVLHVTADALHACAAACWVGGLVPFALLLTSFGYKNSSIGYSIARATTQRFSLLGIVSVAVLLISGMVNAWILVGSFRSLLVTPYGRLLMLKISVFVFMLAIAAANRFWWTAQLSVPAQGYSKALRQLTINSVFEMVLGFAIFAIVGVLGTMHPAFHGL